MCDSIQSFQGFHQRLSNGVIGPIGLARPAQIDVYHPILDLDTAVSAETIVDLNNASVSLPTGGTFEIGVQGSGNQIL